MRNKVLLVVFFSLFFLDFTYAKGLSIRSVRLKFSRPETLHSLLYKDSNVGFEKVTYNLDPKNNERFGFFVDLNGFLIGYSFDPFTSNTETKTTDVILSSEKFKNSKLNFNYQVLEGFQVKVADAFGGSTESSFLKQTESTKIELFGLHNFHTFTGNSLFNHFFLNRPQHSQTYKLSLSLVGAWSARRLKLENPDNIIFRPSFFDKDPLVFNKINAYSLNFTSGPMASFNLPKNFHAFAESKIGLGYFKNLNSDQRLKQSGTEFVFSYGGGVSWTSSNKKFLSILKGWFQEGRHIETFFGDLSLIYFF